MDIGNAYINAANKEKVHARCDPELFGPECEGCIAIIARALYNLQSPGNAWHHHFSKYIRKELGFRSTQADIDGISACTFNSWYKEIQQV